METNNDRKRDRFWNQLLGTISKGNVVPIVGEDLLLLPGAPQIHVFQELAHRYANYCDLKVEASGVDNLSITVRSHPEFRDNPHDIYQEIGQELDDWNPPIPEALNALAKITHFNLFVSTTFDNLLERAINNVRFGGAQKTIVIPYSPKDIPDDQQVGYALSSGYPVIFQLFGSHRNPLKFALTDGDKVEYMHALQSEAYSPHRILNELFDRPLLMLGNNFPDWFARFFLRLTRKTALDHRDIPKQYFAEKAVTQEPMLKFFLQRFTTNTELIEDLSPHEFITKLSEHWLDKQQTSATLQPSVTLIEAATKPMPKNAIFISYCASNSDGSPSDDCNKAQAIKKSLEQAGVEVWLDKEELHGGDDYERKIERYIKTCSIFVPLISETTNLRSSGFFRKEWNWALNRLPDFTGSNRRFLFPIALGNLNPYDALIPEEFKRVQIVKMTSPEPEADLISKIKELYTTVINGLV